MRHDGSKNNRLSAGSIPASPTIQWDFSLMVKQPTHAKNEEIENTPRFI